MINLLPPLGQKRLRREYRLRFLSTLMLATSMVLITFFLFSVPTWFMQRYQIRSVHSGGDFMVRIEAARKAQDQAEKEINALIRHLSASQPDHQHSRTLARLDELAGSDISLTQFTFDSKNRLTVAGIADTRVALSAFRDALDAEPRFSKIELPLSSLVSERNAAFTVTMTVQ